MIESWEFNNMVHEECALVLTYIPAGYQDWVRWNPDIMDWEPAPTTWEEECYIVNGPASVAMSELQNHGDAEQAYRGLDYFDDSMCGTEIAELQGWAELKMPHTTHYDWVEDHSVYLT